MEEKKKTTTRKKTTTKNTTDTKPADSVISVDADAHKTREQLDEDIANGDKAVQAVLMNSNNMVRFYVPRDITSGDGGYFERSFNGHIIRLRAGEIRELPEYIVDFIEKVLNRTIEREKTYSDYQSKNGKALND